MTTSEPAAPQHLRLLAGHLAGYAVDIAEAPAGEPAYTDGRVVYVSHGAAHDERRREVLVQSALLGAGSLDPLTIRPLRARASWSRRYLAIEGRRVLADVATRLPLAAALSTWGAPETTSAAESLELARSRTRVAEAPSWFGVLKPARVAPPPASAGSKASEHDLSFEIDSAAAEDDDPDDGDGPPEESKILKLFDNPLFNSQAVGDFLRKLLGSSPGASANSPGGAELHVEAARHGRAAGPGARPLPTRIQFTDDANPGAAVGVGGALYPEWDVFSQRYRPEWCRVIDYPFTAAADVSAAAVAPDNVLRHRLSRVGLGPKVLRRRADGDDLDIEALVDLTIDLRSGFSPPEQVYTEHRKVARNLGVLILLDASGSATDADPQGLAVHEHQRRAAATIAATLEDLGDRVAVYAFRSKGRGAVHLPAIKAFEQRFGAISRARLTQLRPANYTRLGAAVRGAGEILKAQAGTPNRLLLVLSDGHPYDDGYEGRYAEADARKALEELRADGVGCLCLSIGAATDADALERVFGSASYAAGASLCDLSIRMDELFLGALRELAAPRTPPAYARIDRK
ncbi:VWA domain-containing protein [Mycobacterium sp. EPG1]|nr:VWA domain-containing protein [Mycobacterium sp. EPG1]